MPKVNLSNFGNSGGSGRSGKSVRSSRSSSSSGNGGNGKTKIEFVNHHELVNLMKDIQEITNKDTPKIVRNVTKDYLRGAYEATPLSEKYRKVVPVYYKGKIYKWRKASKKILIAGRGFAKACWIKAMQTMGLNNKYGANQKGKREAYQLGRIEIDDKDCKSSIEVANQAPYIKKLDASDKINDAGMSRAKRMMEQGLNKLRDSIYKRQKQ